MSLATTADIAAYLGRDLGEAETTSVESLIAAADAVIAAAADIAVDDLDGTTDTILPIIAKRIVCRALANPQGIASLQEQLGQYGNTVRFRDINAGGDLLLTDREELIVRRAVHGTNSGSGSGRSMIDRLRDLQENRDVDEPET